MSSIGINRSLPAKKGKSAGRQIIDAISLPSNIVQGIFGSPIRELVDAADADASTKFSIGEMLGLSGTQGATFGQIVREQPWLAKNLPAEAKIALTLAGDIFLDPLNYIGVGLLTKPVKAAKALGLSADMAKGVEAGLEAAQVAGEINKIKGVAAVGNAADEAVDVAKAVSRVGQRVNARRIQTDLLTNPNLVNVADRATEAGRLFRGGVAELLPETQQALGYQSNLVFKIPFTEKAVLIPGTEKIGKAISVTGGRVFKGGFNSLVTSIDPKYWIGEEAMTLRMAANADLAEEIPDGMIRHYEMPDGSWTTSKYQAVKNMTDVSAGIRVADVPESALASSGWSAKLQSVAGMSDDEARKLLPGVNLSRLDVPYELPKAFAGVQGRRLWRAIQAKEAGQILHDVIINGRSMHGIKDIRLSLNQMSDLGAAVWSDGGKFRQVIEKAITDTRDSLVNGDLWRVPEEIADRWVEDTLKVLDEHADELKDLATRPAEFAARKKAENVGIMAKLGEQGKKAGELRAAVAVDGSIAEAARLSQGLIRMGSEVENADAIAALFDDMKVYGKSRGLTVESPKKAAAKAAKAAAPKSPEQQIVEMIKVAKGATPKSGAAPTDVAAQLLLGGLKPDEARVLLQNLGAEQSLIDDLLRPFAGSKGAVDLRRSINALIAKGEGNPQKLAELLLKGQTAEDAVRFWEHILANGWDELFDGSAPVDFIKGLLDGTNVDPADWLKLAEQPVLGDPSKLKPALGLTVKDSSGAKQVVAVVRSADEIPDAVHVKVVEDLATGMGGAKSASEYAALKASETVSARQALREQAQQALEDVQSQLPAAEERLSDAREYADLVDDPIRKAYAKYFKSKADQTDPVMIDWVMKEIAPAYSQSLTTMKRGMAAFRKSVQSDLAILDNLSAYEQTVAGLRKQAESARNVLDNTPSGVSADDLAAFERRWQDAYDSHFPQVDSKVRKDFAAHEAQVAENQKKMVAANQRKVDNLVSAQKEMVEKVLGKYRMKAMSANQKVAELADQQNKIQTELGQLLAMETSLNNAAFAVGDQVDKFTAYLYRDIQAQHVDLLQRAQKLGVSLNTSGDADVIFMEAAAKIAQMNEDAAAELLGFASVGEAGNLRMPKKMAEFITAKQNAGEFSKLTRFWRSSAILRPGFSNRNFIGAWFNNKAQGIRYIDYQTSAFVAQALKNNKSVVDVLGKYAAEMGVTPNEVEEAFTILVANSQLVGDMAHGLHSGTKIGNMMDRGQAFMERWSFAKQGYLRHRNPTKAMSEAAREVTVEDNVRLAQYLGLRRQGFSHMASMNQTLGTHFNYLDSSILDAKIRKYAPFWTYQSRNLGLQAQLMLSHPETTRAFWSTREELRKDQGENLPPWLAGFALPFGNTVMDFSGVAPAGDLVRMGDYISRFPGTPDKSVMALTSQVLGGPQYSAAQLLFNKDLFRGGSRIYKPESAASDVVQYLARSVGPVQQTLSTWDTLGSGDRDAVTKGFNLLYSLGLMPNKKEYTPQ